MMKRALVYNSLPPFPPPSETGSLSLRSRGRSIGNAAIPWRTTTSADIIPMKNIHETQYDICVEHIQALHRNLGRLSHTMGVYRDSDHTIDHLDSPFLLDLNLDAELAPRRQSP